MIEENIVKNFDEQPESSFFSSVLLPALIILLIIFAGGATGYLLSKSKMANSIKGSITNSNTSGSVNSTSNVKEAGNNNPTVYKDKSQGRLEVNDNQNIPDGSHKLIRQGGDNQTVYLVSTVVDLNQFVDKCVEVSGETFSSQKAGWLMDIGYIKVLDSCPSGL